MTSSSAWGPWCSDPATIHAQGQSGDQGGEARGGGEDGVGDILRLTKSQGGDGFHQTPLTLLTVGLPLSPGVWVAADESRGHIVQSDSEQPRPMRQLTGQGDMPWIRGSLCLAPVRLGKTPAPEEMFTARPKSSLRRIK